MLLLFAMASAEPLPDLASTVTRAQCDAPASTTKHHPGAEQFYTGAFVLDEHGELTGVERRYTYANAKWKAARGDLAGRDCVDVWVVSGRKTGDKLTVKGDIDSTQTSCARRLTANGNHFQTTYTLKELADGSFELYFPSGKILGTGQHTKATYSWKSKQTCIWF